MGPAYPNTLTVEKNIQAANVITVKLTQPVWLLQCICMTMRLWRHLQAIDMPTVFIYTWGAKRGSKEGEKNTLDYIFNQKVQNANLH